MAKAKYTRGKDGRFRTRLRTGEYDPITGKPIEVRLSAKSSAELERKVRSYKYELEHGTRLEPDTSTFGEYAEEFVRLYKSNKSIKTKEMYENLLNKISRIEGFKLSEITKDDIQKTIDDEKEHPRTCEQLILLLRQVFENAIKNKIIEESPCVDIELPRRVIEEKRALTEEEKEIIKNADFGPMQKAYIYTLYGTGMRPSEMYALEWSDIDFKNKLISINKGLQFSKNIASVGYPKNNHSIRVIPCSEWVISALKGWHRYSKHPVIFCDDLGRYLTRSAYRNIFDSAMKYAFHKQGKYVHMITPYMFRHNFCTECRRHGMTLEACQKMMGHSSSKMILQIYSHADTMEDMKRVIEDIRL